MPPNWDLYEAEAVRLYITQSKSARHTISALNRKYDCGITMRQFKSKFGRLKNIQAREWKTIGDTIDERQRQGRSSSVYLYDHLQNPRRVEKNTRRYSHYVLDNGARPDMGIETTGRHRIEIRNSAAVEPISSFGPSTGSLQIPVEVGESQGPNGVGPSPMHTEHVIDRVVEIPMEDQEDIFIIRSPLLNVNHLLDRNSVEDNETFGHSPVAANVTNEAGDLMMQMGPSPMSPSFAFFGIESNWPWQMDSFQLYPTKTYTLFWDEPEISMILHSGLHYLNSIGFLSAIVPQKNKGWLQRRLASEEPRLGGLSLLLERVEEIIPMKLPEDKTVKTSLDHANPKLILCAFSVVAHLASNNLVGDEQLRNFAWWVIGTGHIRDLAIFMRGEAPGIKSFKEKILLATCRIRRYLYDPYDPFALERTRMSDYLFVDHPVTFMNLLRDMGEVAISTSMSTRLLLAVSGSDHEEAAKLLINKGANVDGDSSDGHYCPLAVSAFFGSFSMLQLVISAGADVNKRFRDRYGETTPLAWAVRLGRLNAVTALLDAGAKTEISFRAENGVRKPPNMQFQHALAITKWNSPSVHALVLKHMKGDISNTWLMVQQAQMGNNTLEKFLMENNITQDEPLEMALSYAVKWNKREAVRTFLQRRVDANASKFLLSRRERRAKWNAGDFAYIDDNATDLHPLSQAMRSGATELVYLLVKAGGKLNKITDEDNTDDLVALVSAGHEVSMLGPSILETMAGRGGIFECGLVLDAGCPINDYGMNGESALQAAASSRSRPHTNFFQWEGNVALVQYLIDRGADVNQAASESGRTALQAATEQGYWEVVDCLLEAGANVAAPPAKCGGVTVLEAAATNLRVQETLAPYDKHNRQAFEGRSHQSGNVFKKLRALGAPVNRTGDTPGELLHRLIYSNNLECLKLALGTGAEVESRPDLTSQSWYNGAKQATPLQYATNILNLEATRLLLYHGANSNAIAPASSLILEKLKPRDFSSPIRPGFTALQSAAAVYEYRKHPDCQTNGANDGLQIKVVELLLQHGADINAPATGHHGRTALQAACSQGTIDDELICLLLNRGADVNAEPADLYGRTALQAVCSERRTSHYPVHLLSSKGADVNAPPARIGGITALQGAAIAGDLPLVKILLHKGAEINAKPAEEEGRTAIEGAAEHGRLDMVQFLLNKGALPNPVNGFFAAIELAKNNNHGAIADLLQEHQRNCGLQFINQISLFQ